MLIKINEVLVPHDMNPDLLQFIIENEGKSRFIIGMYIPEAKDYKFAYDTAHIVVSDDELRVHSQAHSRTYQLYMYAWEHVYCLVPSAKAKRKLGSGWIHPDAAEYIKDEAFERTWHRNDIKNFIEKHDDAVAI